MLRQPGPDEEGDGAAERCPVGLVVARERAEVDLEPDRCREPQRDRDQAAAGRPRGPAALTGRVERIEPRDDRDQAADDDRPLGDRPELLGQQGRSRSRRRAPRRRASRSRAGRGRARSRIMPDERHQHLEGPARQRAAAAGAADAGGGPGERRHVERGDVERADEPDPQRGARSASRTPAPSPAPRGASRRRRSSRPPRSMSRIAFVVSGSLPTTPTIATTIVTQGTSESSR